MKAHYIPVSYLKGFVDPASEKPGFEPYLWTRDPTAGVWKKRAPRNLAKLSDYYAVTRADGSKDDAREEALSQLESAVAPILRRIVDDDSLSADEFVTLIVFASTMYIRLPVVHDAAEQTALLPEL